MATHFVSHGEGVAEQFPILYVHSVGTRRIIFAADCFGRWNHVGFQINTYERFCLRSGSQHQTMLLQCRSDLSKLVIDSML